MQNSELFDSQIDLLVKAEYSKLDNISIENKIPSLHVIAVFIRGLKRTGLIEESYIRVKAFVRLFNEGILLSPDMDDRDLLPEEHPSHPSHYKTQESEEDIDWGTSFAEDISSGIGKTSDLVKQMEAVIRGRYSLNSFIITYAVLGQLLKEGEWEEMMNSNEMKAPDSLVTRVVDAIASWNVVDVTPLREYIEQQKFFVQNPIPNLCDFDTTEYNLALSTKRISEVIAYLGQFPEGTAQLIKDAVNNNYLVWFRKDTNIPPPVSDE